MDAYGAGRPAAGSVGTRRQRVRLDTQSPRFCGSEGAILCPSRLVCPASRAGRRIRPLSLHGSDRGARAKAARRQSQRHGQPSRPPPFTRMAGGFIAVLSNVWGCRALWKLRKSRRTAGRTGQNGSFCPVRQSSQFLDKIARRASRCFCELSALSKKPMFVRLRSLAFFCPMTVMRKI
jgi:hypothetical protein